MSARADQIATLYEQQARLVQRQVARRVNAPTAIIEDACQTAWERLCTHPGVEPVAPSAVKWLVVTAMREAWRRAGGREIPTDPTDFAEPISDTPGPLERAIASEHSDELRDQLLGLTDRERQFLALQAAGLTYAEIAQRTDTTPPHRRTTDPPRPPQTHQQGVNQASMAALATMRLQTISYRGRPVACATATRFFLTDALERLPAGDPVLTFVLYMCAYAREVHTGELPGRYTDHDARRFARAALVPEELADPDRIAHTHRNLQRTARALKLPAAELAAALDEIVRAAAAQPQQACTRPLRRGR